MDSLYDHRIGRTVFGKLDPTFWNKDQSWKSSKMIFKYRIDAWHLFKSGMIVMAAVSAVFSAYYGLTIKLFDIWILDVFVEMVIRAGLWIQPFNLFYDKIWIKKNKSVNEKH